MKIRTINHKKYFADYIKVNWKLPFQELSNYNRQKLIKWYRGIIPFLCDNLHKWNSGIKVLKRDNHYNIKIEWTSQFWVNKPPQNIKSNVYNWYKSFIHINGWIDEEWSKHFGNEYSSFISSPHYKHNNETFPRCSHVTIARFDFAENKNGNLVDAIPIKHKNVAPPNYFEVDKGRKPYIGGISIGKRTNGTYFRAYDKRFDLDGMETCLRRFKSINFVRREWELKRDSLRKYGIQSPEDLMTLAYDKNKITELIYRCRLNRDVILKSDKKLYRSIHDDVDKARINPLDNYTMSGHEFNDMIKKDYNVFLKKVHPKDVKRMAFNPFKQLNGLIQKKGIYLNSVEIINLIQALVGVEYLNECAEDEYTAKYKETLDLIKNDKRIKEGLEKVLATQSL